MKMMNDMMDMKGNMIEMEGMKMQNQEMDMNTVMYPEITGPGNPKDTMGRNSSEKQMQINKAIKMRAYPLNKLSFLIFIVCIVSK